jgi:hypothetical protein
MIRSRDKTNGEAAMDTNAAEAAGFGWRALRKDSVIREMNDDARLNKGLDPINWCPALERWNKADKDVILKAIAENPGYCDGGLLDEDNLHRAGVVRIDRKVYVWEIEWFLLPYDCHGDWEEEPCNPRTDAAIWPRLSIYTLEEWGYIVGPTYAGPREA